MIIDSHVHFNELEGSYDKSYQKLLSDMETNKIEKCIIIPDNVIGSGCADINTSLKFASSKTFVVGSPNILIPKDGEFEYLRDLLEHKKIIGLKLFPGHDAFYANDERCDKYFKLCLSNHSPIIFHTGINTGNVNCAKYNDPELIIDVARKYPELKIVIAHYFWPKMEYCYEITRGFDNLYFDTSAMADPEVVNLSGGIKKVKEILERTILDNEESVIFGTDYPECDVTLHIDLINSLNITDEIRKKIFQKNANKLFNI